MNSTAESAKENKKTKPNYRLNCVYCNEQVNEDGFVLSHNTVHEESLLRAVYDVKHLTPGPDSMGIYKFADWMPVPSSGCSMGP